LSLHEPTGIGTRIAALLLAACIAAACAGCTSQAASQLSSAESTASIAATPPVALDATRDTGPARGYRLRFAEEFDAQELDSTRWAPELAWGPVNRTEQQYYTADALSLADGKLSLTARAEPLHGMPYTSGAINSYQRYSFAYGYVETRAKVPAGKGLWSAVWLMTREPNSVQEIDVVEVIGSRPDAAHAAMHWGTLTERHQVAHDFKDEDLSKEFHTYAMEWTPERIVWYVDGIARFETTEHIPSEHMYVVANLAVGGPRSWGGAPNDETVFPAQMQIDYIRVYQLP